MAQPPCGGQRFMHCRLEGPPNKIHQFQVRAALEDCMKMSSLRNGASGLRVACGLRPPASSLRPPASGLRSPASGLRPPASGVRPPAPGLRPPASGLWPPASCLWFLASGPRPLASRLRFDLQVKFLRPQPNLKKMRLPGPGCPHFLFPQPNLRKCACLG